MKKVKERGKNNNNNNKKLEGVASNRGQTYPEENIVLEVKKGECFIQEGRRKNVLCVFDNMEVTDFDMSSFSGI